jgi:hypothetical protein
MYVEHLIGNDNFSKTNLICFRVWVKSLQKFSLLIYLKNLMRRRFKTKFKIESRKSVLKIPQKGDKLIEFYIRCLLVNSHESHMFVNWYIYTTAVTKMSKEVIAFYLQWPCTKSFPPSAMYIIINHLAVTILFFLFQRQEIKN